ncbi:hypothetical protein E6C67_11115 [Azospirillum sp. TSA2s]|uniref:hypothetical protein n=1 Tax=Azospirillum sp. TSA2s TaxID=709810 RepID=UPI0010AADBD5|nr:hypothetical protein [Azospirillum sp. TSA2s]QCG94469.1 hypothetical protein E6C67_11115 [Azospirillum sp. TSA2s]
MPLDPNAVTGASAEALVMTRLLSFSVNVARPVIDSDRIDLIAFNVDHAQVGLAPVQVKGSAGQRYQFRRDLFDTPGISFVLVWYALAETPRFFVFGCLADVEAALGDSVHSPSWLNDGSYSMTPRGAPAILPQERIRLMIPHEDRWDRILNKIGIAAPIPAIAVP